MNLVVVMLPAAERMQRRQERQRADDAVQPAQTGKAVVHGVVADDREVGDEDARENRKPDLRADVVERNRGHRARGIERETHDEDGARKGHPAAHEARQHPGIEIGRSLRLGRCDTHQRISIGFRHAIMANKWLTQGRDGGKRREPNIRLKSGKC